MEKETKYLKELSLNIWQQDENTIHFKVMNPHEGKGEWLCSIEHTDKHNGKQMARTHNNLFRDLKAVLEANGKWIESNEKEQ